MVHLHDLNISCSTLRRAPISDRNFQFHAKSSHKFRVNTDGAIRPDEEQLAVWRRGVVLEDVYRTAPAEVRLEAPFGKGAWLRVTLREGKKRQIREVGKTIGLPVVKIIWARMKGDLRRKKGKSEPQRARRARGSETCSTPEREGQGGTGGGKAQVSPAPPAPGCIRSCKAPAAAARQVEEGRGNRPAAERPSKRPTRLSGADGYRRSSRL